MKDGPIRDWPKMYIDPEHHKKIKEVAKEMGRDQNRQLQWMLEQILYNRKYY